VRVRRRGYVLLDDDQVVSGYLAAGQESLHPVPDRGRGRMIRLEAVEILRPLTVGREVAVAGVRTFNLVENRVLAGALASVALEEP